MTATATRQEEGMPAPANTRDEAYRVLGTGVEYRAAVPARADDDSSESTAPGIMTGHFAVFGRATEIDSWFEGNFMEVIDPGAFKKTISEGRDDMRVLFQHGHDPQIGDKPIGTILDLREDDVGAYYEVQLLDAGYVTEDIEPGLKAGVYGASFRFRVIREEWNEDPGVSAENPKGLPLRTLKELEVREFGPVTWGAYSDATAGMRGRMRSVTDEIYFDRLAADPDKLGALIERLEVLRDAPPADGEAPVPDAPAEEAPEGATSGDTPPSGDEQDPEAGSAGDTPEGAVTTDEDEGRSATAATPDEASTSRGTDLYTGQKGSPSWLL